MAEKEYIERGAFKERLKDFSEWCRDGRKQGVDFVLDCSLPNMPAADVVEVVHARWIDHKNGNATCSHCRIRQTAVYDDDNEQNFCGHCGANMDGGAE